MSLEFVSLLAATLLTQAVHGDDEPKVLEAMDVFELELASDPQISPDGEKVVYVRQSMDVMTDGTRSRLWIADFGGGDARPLTAGEENQSSPRWSPDGTRIVYVSGASGSAQIHLRWMDTGQTARLTQVLDSPSSIAWSPDGRRLAFSMLVPDETKPLAEMPSAPKGAEWAAPPIVIEELHYRADGAGYTRPGRTHVFVLPIEGGTPRRLTHDDADYGGTLAWTADGESLIVAANRDEDDEFAPREAELWELSVEDGSMTRLTERVGPDLSPAVSPDGRMIAYTGFDDRLQGYQVVQLYVMNRDGSGVRSLTAELDRSASDPTWAGDGSGVFFSYDDRGSTYLAFARLDGGIEIVAEDLGGLSIGRPYSGASYSVARDGRFAFTQGGPHQLSDVAVARLGDRGENEARRLTALNDDLFAIKDLGEVEEVWADSSHDGRKIQGWIVKPPGFDPAQTYPLILEIHGGPFANYGNRFSMECQLYAAAGYVVLYTNPRGSTGYGEEFGNLIHHDYPSQDYDDLMSSVDAVLAKGYVDPERLYVTGGSGGGVLTAWIVGKTKRFRAAVVAKPVINWTSFVLTADAYPFFTKYWFSGYPWEVHEEYWRRSPLSLVGNVETPTMLLTGEADYRTPISESEQFYQALKLRKVDSALVRIPGASHGIASRPSRLIAKVAHVLGWFERYSPGDDED